MASSLDSTGPGPAEEADKAGRPLSPEAQSKRYAQVHGVWKYGEWHETQNDGLGKEKLFVVYVGFDRTGLSNVPQEPVVFVKLRSNALVQLFRGHVRCDGPRFSHEPLYRANDIFLVKKDLELAKREADKAIQPSSASASMTPALRSKAEEADHLGVLLAWLQEEFGPLEDELGRLGPNQEISYDLLWYLFRPHQEAVIPCEMSKEKLGIIITKTRYIQLSEEMKSFFSIEGTMYDWDGVSYRQRSVSHNIRKFSGTMSIADLTAHIVSAVEKEQLKQRGAAFESYTNIGHLEYESILIEKAKDSVGCIEYRKINATGRVMIDAKGLRTYRPFQSPFDDDGAKPSHRRSFDDDDSSNGDGFQRQDGIRPDDLWQLPPVLPAFSFRLKQWGHILVDKLDRIEYERNALDRLVLSSRDKDLVKSLVKSSTSSKLEEAVPDVISHKGRGCVICLHGPPGCGKTLTAAAIGETLQRPLYVIAGAELGVSPESVEKQLGEALELCQRWDAVALIDEADVYLEKRGLHELQRNALVSIFLRLLDSSSGVLFLTTNRVKTFDPAFNSRFTLALKYPALDESARANVWKQFFALAHISVEGEPTSHPVSSRVPAITNKLIERWASKPFDGRKIRNIFRAAQAIASDHEVPLSPEHIDTVIEASEAFEVGIPTTD